MTRASEIEAGQLLQQADANRLHAELNPSLSPRQRKRLLKAADAMQAHAMHITRVTDPDILRMTDDELLAELSQHF